MKIQRNLDSSSLLLPMEYPFMIAADLQSSLHLTHEKMMFLKVTLKSHIAEFIYEGISKSELKNNGSYQKAKLYLLKYYG